MKLPFKFRLPRLGLYSRFFLLFSLTTLFLAIFIALGSFTFSETKAKEVVEERHEKLYEMMTSFHDQEIDLEKMKDTVKGPKVDLKVTREGEVWTTWEEFPDFKLILPFAEKIGSLHFARYEGRYYLLAHKEKTWVGVTSKFVNLIVYPGLLVYWPWLMALVVLTLSYRVLRKWLRPVADAIQSAQMVSKGDFKYRIEHHPNTELAELTHGLNKMAADLQQLFDAKNELLLAISHELRTPMARMKISLAMLDDDDQVAADLNKDIKHMDSLIEQLLEGERLEQGHKVLHLSSYYLPSLIDDIVAEQEEQSRIKLSTEVPEEAVQLDVGRIKFLLRNLLRNAIEHSPEGVQISLSVEQSDSEFIFKVTDNGPGIPAESLQDIFEPFYCVENIANRSTNGVGLGLYLCQKIAIAHNGELTVTSEMGKGSCFCLKLPK